MTARTKRIGVLSASVATAALVLTLAWRFGPALTLTLGLAFPGSEAWLARADGDVERREITISRGDVAIVADLYEPRAARGAFVLVHGLSRHGRRHPELERLARLLARHGRRVLVPDFPSLKAFRLNGRERHEVAGALAYLREREPTAALGVAGFSFGAGPAILAAADVADVDVTGSFGGYADLRAVIRFVTTGVHELHGRRYVAQQEAYNRWKLLALLVDFIAEPGDRDVLGAIAEKKLADPSQDTAALEGRLGPSGRSMLALVTNRRDEAVSALIASLPPSAHESLDRLSPLAAVARLRGRLALAHGAADDSIPFTETLRLAAAARCPHRVAILQSFHHTGPQSLAHSLVDYAHDAWHLVRLSDLLLSGRGLVGVETSPRPAARG